MKNSSISNHSGWKSRRGMTLVELTIAAGLTGIIMIGVYMMWASMAKEWMRERVKSSLNEELQVDITRMKKEMRLSSGTEIFYNPVGSPPYSAVSFPIPIDNNNDNLIEMDGDNNIIWDRTILYHVFTNEDGETELRRTVFNPRDTTLTAAERQEQLDTVVDEGNGEGTFNSANATTTVLFSGLEKFEIVPSLVTVDGYSDVLERTEFISFGSVLLTPGDHTLRFEVTGKNALSSDYHFAIDALVLSPSGGQREAEELLPETGSSGEATENIDLSAVGSWNGHAHMHYNANGVGDYVELTVYHDEWIETNFDDATSVRDGTDIEFVADIDPHEIVARLDGMRETWTADTPTGSSSASYDADPPSLPDMRNTTLRTIISRESLLTKGERVRALFRAHNSAHNLKIMSAYIEERSSGQDGVSATKMALFFSNAEVVTGADNDMTLGAVGVGPTSVTVTAGHEVYSNWIDFPIDTDKEYLVTYYIADEGNMYYPSYHAGSVSSVNSYYRTGDFANDSSWSSDGTSFAHVVGLESLQVTHPATGTWTSQIYDTKVDNPAYGNLTWEETVPTGTDVKIFLRSSDDPEMDDDPAWTEFTSSPSAIPGTFVGRYVQLMAEMSSPSPYYETPYLLKSSVRWPGEETLVDIGGYFSKNVDYGIIKLTVDGQELAKSVEVKIKMVDEYLGKEFSSTISSEIEPRNTPE